MKRIFFVFILIFIAFSCEDEIYNPIPNALVNLNLDLAYEDSSLYDNPLAYKTFINKRYATDKIGYGGILVINAGYGNTLYAYDLACPVEISPTIRVIPNDVGEAHCPQCGSKFCISDGTGRPISGKSKHTLKRYRVSPQGEKKYLVTR